MPVVYINIERLGELTGEKIQPSRLEAILFNLKSESKVVDDSHIEVEVNSDRPDLFTSEGLARAIKGLLEVEVGLFQPKIGDSLFSVNVSEVPSRPFIAVGVVRNVSLGEEGLKELIQFQEKLHITIGRRRKKVAIGIHDLKKIEGHSLIYSMVPLDAEMIPLDNPKRMKIKDVLRETPQGKSYGDLSLLGGAHPAILSEGGEIISLPPVINSDITRLEPSTKDLLIDVTGTDLNSVVKTLDLISSLMNEHKGSSIERVKIYSQPGSLLRIDPLLSRFSLSMSRDLVTKTLGFELSRDVVIKHLLKMRFGVEELQPEGSLKVVVPEYRLDILHPIDLVEDIAMSYGYENLPAVPPNYKTEGSVDEITSLSRVLRMTLIGLGFQEVHSFIALGTHAELFKGNAELLKIRNPVSEEMQWIRPNLSSSLLYILKENQHVELPLKIFEIGDFAHLRDGKLIQGKSLAMAVMKDELSFEEIQAPAFSLLSHFGINVRFRKSNVGYLIEGRAATIIAEDIPVGVVGEVHPHILTEMQIKYPVGVAEIDLGLLRNVFKNIQR